MKPRSKAPEAVHLKDPLCGELLAFSQVGMWQQDITSRTAYRHRGILLRYQEDLGEREPSLQTSLAFSLLTDCILCCPIKPCQDSVGAQAKHGINAEHASLSIS